jgi:hypothetical protein
MPGQEDSHEIGATELNSVAACTQKLGTLIGELAQRYGTAAVVVALTEVVGCWACAKDGVDRGASIRALIERMSTV